MTPGGNTIDWNRWHELLDIQGKRPFVAEERVEYINYVKNLAALDVEEAAIAAPGLEALIEGHERVLASIERLTKAVRAAGDAVPTSDALWLPATRVKLESFRDLKANWDSYGAAPPDPVAIEQATKFAEFVNEAGISKPHVAPCNSGCIAFEWTGGCELEMEIGADGAIHYLLNEDDEGSTDDWQVVVDMLLVGGYCGGCRWSTDERRTKTS